MTALRRVLRCLWISLYDSRVMHRSRPMKQVVSSTASRCSCCKLNASSLASMRVCDCLISLTAWANWTLNACISSSLNHRSSLYPTARSGTKLTSARSSKVTRLRVLEMMSSSSRWYGGQAKAPCLCSCKSTMVIDWPLRYSWVTSQEIQSRKLWKLQRSNKWRSVCVPRHILRVNQYNLPRERLLAVISRTHLSVFWIWLHWHSRISYVGTGTVAKSKRYSSCQNYQNKSKAKTIEINNTSGQQCCRNSFVIFSFVSTKYSYQFIFIIINNKG